MDEHAQRPEKRKRIVALLSVGAVLVAFFWCAFVPDQASYKGRSLYNWLTDDFFKRYNSTSDARDAVRAIGADAVPELKRMLKAEPNNLSFLEKARAAIPCLARTPTPLVEDRELALHVCIILGPAAEPLFPTLRDLLIRDPSWNAARALAAGGPVASPHLAEALAHANADVRLYALYALVDPDSDSEQDLDALAPPLLRLLRTSKGNEADLEDRLRNLT